jgi:hypothetical protein
VIICDDDAPVRILVFSMLRHDSLPR